MDAVLARVDQLQARLDSFSSPRGASWGPLGQAPGATTSGSTGSAGSSGSSTLSPHLAGSGGAAGGTAGGMAFSDALASALSTPASAGGIGSVNDFGAAGASGAAEAGGLQGAAGLPGAPATPASPGSPASPSRADAAESARSPRTTGTDGVRRSSGAAEAAPAPGRGAFGDSVVTEARKYLGVPYVWGGTNPRRGLDCSGLVQLVFRNLGVELPRVARDQAKQGTVVPSLSQAQPGDLLGMRNGTHIAIYLGDNKILHAPRPGEKVSIRSLYSWDDIDTIRRVSPPASASTAASRLAFERAAA